MKGNHSAETGGMVLICRFLFDEPIAVVAFFNEGQRRKGRKRRAEYHWPAAWPAAAVGSGKSLVEIDMHGVDAQIAGAHPPYDGIEIRDVTIHNSTCFMNGIGDILHVAFEERSEEHTSELKS